MILLTNSSSSLAAVLIVAIADTIKKSSQGIASKQRTNKSIENAQYKYCLQST